MARQRFQKSMLDAARSPLTYNIIGALMDVHADMGPGYLEKSYQEAVEIALAERGVPCFREAAIPVRYRSHVLKTVYRADFICGGKVILELKAQSAMGPIDDAQIIHYLKASEMPVGILANFGEESLVFRRFVGPTNVPEIPI